MLNRNLVRSGIWLGQKSIPIWSSQIQDLAKFLLVRLSLLTMTNPNQLCDVFLFVCSKMADEANLSSKLPVADRIREV